MPDPAARTAPPTAMIPRPSLLRSALSPLFLSAITAMPAFAQITTSEVDLGAAGAFGCQGTANPPTLTGGILASAHLVFTYDASLARLRLEVENTSPVVPGQPNPLIAQLLFNTPHLAVTGLQLLSQSGAGGAAPAFALSFDPDTTNGGNRGACLGEFNAVLSKSAGGPHGAISNPNADTIGGRAGAAVTGPVVFEFQVFGTNLAGLRADAFTSSLSRGGVDPAVAAIHFQAAGPGAAESGWLADAVGCRRGVWVAGVPRIGSTVQLVTSGDVGCHGCLMISLFPGPTIISGVEIPVGFPMLLEAGIFLTGAADALPIPIPEDPALRGITVYFGIAVFDANSPAGFNASQGFQLTIE